MSIEVMTWVFKYSEVNVPGRRLVLISLADRADPDGTKVFPSIETVARDTRMSERGVRYALRALEAAGAIQKVGVNSHHNGTTEYVVLMTPEARGAKSAPRQTATVEGGKSAQNAGATVAPKPSLLQPPEEPSKLRAARTSDDWPEKLQNTATAQEVLDTLIEVAHDHGSPTPTRKAVGHLLLAFPDRAHLVEARKMASWWADKQVKRVAQTYRNWLEGADAVSVGVRNIKSAPSQKLEAKSSDERGKLRAWAAENLPDLPESQVLSAATRLQYAGHEVTANRVRAYLEQATS